MEEAEQQKYNMAINTAREGSTIRSHHKTLKFHKHSCYYCQSQHTRSEPPKRTATAQPTTAVHRKPNKQFEKKSPSYR
jgi:hypothetical protein